MKFYCIVDSDNRITSYSFEKFTNAIEIESDTEPKANYDKIINSSFIKATEEDIQNFNKFLKEQKAQRESIAALKAELEKVKEDIEQVDLFGMVRSDTALKRIRAVEIVNELKELEGIRANY